MNKVKKLKTGIITVEINGRIEVFTPKQYEQYVVDQKKINRAFKTFNFVFVVLFTIGVLTGVIQNHLN